MFYMEYMTLHPISFGVFPPWNQVKLGFNADVSGKYIFNKGSGFGPINYLF